MGAEASGPLRGAVAGGLPAPLTRASCFDFAGIRIAFECSDERWLASLSQRFEGFATDAAPVLTIRYLAVEDAAPPLESPFPALRVTTHGPGNRDTIELAGPAFTATAPLLRPWARS